MDLLNKELKEKALTLGLCEGWTNEWSTNKDHDELIGMYKRGLDFCFEKSYPSNDYIKSHFDNLYLQKNGIYIDHKESILYKDRQMVVMGDSKSKLSFSNFEVCDIYLKDSSTLEIEVSHCAKVFINLYGFASVHVIQKGAAKVYVYKHETNCSASYDGDIMIRQS